MSSPHNAARLDQRYLHMLKLLNIYLNHFPRHERYALANRIRNTAYAVYDLITEAQKRYHKKTTLTQMDIAHEQLRMQVRLAYELGYLAFKDGKTSDQSPEQLALRRLTALEAHARHTATHAHYCRRLRQEAAAVIPRLPLYQEVA